MADRDDADDPAHPIPQVGNLDVVGKLRTGGVELAVIIAEPLAADARSQNRLLQKLENYLGFVLSPDYRAEFGEPSPTNTRIVVNINDRSDPAIFRLLQSCQPLALANKATLVVQRKPPAT